MSMLMLMLLTMMLHPNVKCASGITHALQVSNTRVTDMKSAVRRGQEVRNTLT
jgi:hypothetical protein